MEKEKKSRIDLGRGEEKRKNKNGRKELGRWAAEGENSGLV